MKNIDNLNKYFILIEFKKIDEALAELFQFNKELVTFDATLTELNTWITGRYFPCRRQENVKRSKGICF